MRSGTAHTLRSNVAVCTQADPGVARAFIVSCLEVTLLQPQQPPWSPALPYLILDAAPPGVAQLDAAPTEQPELELQRRVVQLVVGCCCNSSSGGSGVRAALRVAQAFGVRSTQLQAVDSAVASLRACVHTQLTGGNANGAPGVALTLVAQFPEVGCQPD